MSSSVRRASSEPSPSPEARDATVRSRPHAEAADEEVSSGESPEEERSPEERSSTLILHYHLFKNAGTSVDSAFKDSFETNEWVSKEFEGNAERNRRDVAAWMTDTPGARCFSSHTAQLPPPSLPGREVFPVIFIRHPLDRIASAYAFEVKQDSPSFGSVLARNTTLAGYVETRLSLPGDGQCRDFQAHRLADMYPASEGDLRERAMRAIEELPFVGLVESYDRSLQRLQALLRERGFPDIVLGNLAKNVSRSVATPLVDKLKRLRNEVGAELFETLREANAVDLELHARLSARYGEEK